MMLVALVGVATLLTLNLVTFGHPLEFGYPETTEGGKRLNNFETPLSVGLQGFLLSPGKSVFIFAPPILLVLLGLPRLWRRDAGLATLASLLPLAYLFLFARYTQWEGAFCVGSRYLVPSLAVLCIALGPALAAAGRWRRAAAIVLLLAGFVVQGIGLATSFMEDQTQRSVYFDEKYNYQMSYSPLQNQGALLLKYAVASEPAPRGRGFDRWFLFLARNGVAPATVAALVAVIAAGLLISAWRLGRGLARENV